MMQFLLQFNREHEGTGDIFNIGIGINTGPVVAGYMGSSKSMEYTAIGDNVNLASRLCANAPPGTILVSANTMAQIGNRYASQQLPPIQVKGKQHPVDVWRITGYAYA
jgi:adenylate cyclase